MLKVSATRRMIKSRAIFASIDCKIKILPENTAVFLLFLYISLAVFRISSSCFLRSAILLRVSSTFFSLA